MRFLVGESGSGKTYYIQNKIPDIETINVEDNKEFMNALNSSTTGRKVLINIFYSFRFESFLKSFLNFPAYLEFHTENIKIPKEYIAYVMKFKIDKEAIKKFCGLPLENWYDAVIYKKYGIVTKLPKKRSELYYIKKLEFRYFKFKYSGLIQYV